MTAELEAEKNNAAVLCEMISAKEEIIKRKDQQIQKTVQKVAIITKEKNLLEKKHHSEVLQKMSVSLFEENLKNVDLSKKSVRQDE